MSFRKKIHQAKDLTVATFRQLGGFGGKRILLYTDSRGTNLDGHRDYNHYGVRLRTKYKVDAYFCPEKWTTILDFFNLEKTCDFSRYDVIVLHAGAVDAAPRHQKILQHTIYPQKREIFNEVFGENRIQAHLESDLGCDYEGDKTNNMYSLDMAAKDIIPRLQKLPNLIWVGSNRIIPDWRGNYWKDRPANVRIIEKYNSVFLAKLEHAVNLSDWTDDEIMENTFDNIHPTEKGSNIIYDRLQAAINRIA